MKKIKINIFLVVYLLIIALAILALITGCNPVKRVLNNPKYYNPIAEHVISSGACVNDSVYISDTTIVFDTLHAVDYKTDTVRVGDSIYIDRVEYREKLVRKTVTIKDTAIIQDFARINLLQKQLIKKDGELFGKTEQLKQSQAETKAARQGRDKWRFRFFLLLAAFGIWVFKKPLIRLVKPNF